MLNYRFAQESDVDLYYEWANDESVRSNSYNQSKIDYDSHVKWFLKKLLDKNCFFYLFFNKKNEAVGQVRIEKKETETIIGISIDSNHRGNSYSTEMLKKSCNDYLEKHPFNKISAYIKIENTSSLKSFEKSGFRDLEEVIMESSKSYKLSYNLFERD
jgi:RimJ/RimL family protein N-acetyltransferase